MSDRQVSPDGKWQWDGTQWIPTGPAFANPGSGVPGGSALGSPDGPPKKAWFKKWWGIGLIGFGGLVLAVAVFGGDTQSTATDAPTPTPTQTSAEERTGSLAPTEEPAPTTTVTVTATPTDEPEPQAAATSAKSTPAGVNVAKVKVPDAVGKNYQLAQDMWRAKGLIVMPAEDALGLDRLALLDENWVVVGQSPKAGAKVKEGSEIRATIKKYTD